MTNSWQDITPGESHADCLARELREELALEVIVGREILETRYAYPEREVELHFLRCDLRSDPAPQLGQEMRWVARRDLAGMAFPPADERLIRILTDEG